MLILLMVVLILLFGGGGGYYYGRGAGWGGPHYGGRLLGLVLISPRPGGRGEQTDWRGSNQKKPRTQWRHRRRAGEETPSAHADRSRREPCRQPGGQNARGENDGQDIATPRARLEFQSS